MNWISAATTVLSGTAAALAYLPYPWAHTAAGAVAAGVAAMHLSRTVTAPSAYPKRRIIMNEQALSAPETVAEEVPAGPSLMGIAPPNPTQSVASNAVVMPQTTVPSDNPYDILREVNRLHGEAMGVLNQIWQHLTGQPS